MKRRSLLIFLLFILVAVCSVYAWYHYLKTYDTMVSSYENQLEEYKLSAQMLQDQLSEVQEDKNRLEMLADNIESFHMEPPESKYLEAITEKKYMTADNIAIRKVPSDREEFDTGIRLSYDMVYPQYVVWETILWPEQTEDRHWVLVCFYQFGEMVDSVGWVKFSELIEYNEETMHLYKGPFELADDAVALETGEPVDRLFLNRKVSVSFKDGYALVGIEGGLDCKVEEKYIIYPEP